MTISGQQLADINTDLSKARSIQADAQAKSSMIRELLRSGMAADIAEVTNNEIVQRIWDQRSTAQAQLALESRTLLPGHPRIKELTAQVAQYDATLKSAAKQAATSLENEAKIAGQRVSNLETVLGQQKRAAGVANGDEVHLRALERVAQGYKDQLESSTTKYEEAMARQSSTATPADARIISRAVRPQLPSYPKKIPFIVFGTLATLFFAAGYVIAAELLSGRATVGIVPALPARDERQATLPFDDRPQRRATDSVNMPSPSIPKHPTVENGEAWLPKRLARIFARAEHDDPDKLVFAPLDIKDARLDQSLRPRLNMGTRLTQMLDYLRHFGRSAEQSSLAMTAAAETGVPVHDEFGWDDGADSVASKPVDEVVRKEDNTDEIAARIVESHVPGRGLQIVGTSVGQETGASDSLITLSRTLANKGRSLIVDLGTTPMKLAALSDPEQGRAKIMTLVGLSELLAGDAGFAEVIHRDCASRLHFIPTGQQDADFRDFDLILDALSETYDFIVLLTPAFPQSEIAKVMAPYADFVVLTPPIEPDRELLDMLNAELIEAGRARGACHPN